MEAENGRGQKELGNMKQSYVKASIVQVGGQSMAGPKVFLSQAHFSHM